jgi:hypothetical protein
MKNKLFNKYLIGSFIFVTFSFSVSAKEGFVPYAGAALGPITVGVKNPSANQPCGSKNAIQPCTSDKALLESAKKKLDKIEKMAK